MTDIGRSEAQSVLDAAGDDPRSALDHCNALIWDHEKSVTELRSARKQIIQALRGEGMTLDAIARQVGRTKQTVAQWAT